MRVIGSGLVILPIKPAKNGDILFSIHDESAVLQVRAAATHRKRVESAALSQKPLHVDGSLKTYRGDNGTRYHFVLADTVD